jgi:hypothetical protein
MKQTPRRRKGVGVDSFSSPPLCDIHGVPLVLKSDNGSAFIAELFRGGLASCQVDILFSPGRMPSYNGSIEAGIGSLTSRTGQHAARRGWPGEWT